MGQPKPLIKLLAEADIIINAVFQDHPELLCEGDGVHPNAEGYLTLARVIADQIRDSK